MNRIKELREYANLSQAQLASTIGVNQTAVSQWERGATMPKLPQVKKLCDFFGVSDAYLLGESNKKNTPAPSGTSDPDMSELEQIMHDLPPDLRKMVVQYSRDLADVMRMKPPEK